MLLLQMIRDKRQKENQEKKVWIENSHHQDFLTGCKNTSNGLGTEEEECNMQKYLESKEKTFETFFDKLDKTGCLIFPE